MERGYRYAVVVKGLAPAGPRDDAEYRVQNLVDEMQKLFKANLPAWAHFLDAFPIHTDVRPNEAFEVRLFLSIGVIAGSDEEIHARQRCLPMHLGDAFGASIANRYPVMVHEVTVT